MFNASYYRRFMSPRDRIEEMYVVSPNSCWIWIGAMGRGGYGRVQMKGYSTYAHRASYEIFVGPVPDGLELDHLCRVRNCVNWRHLEPVTRSENQRRSPLTMKGKTHCKKGHPLYGENLMFSSNGQRMCRICRNVIVRNRRRKLGDERSAYQREWYAKNRDKMREYHRQNYQANIEKKRAAAREYQRRKRAAAGGVTSPGLR